MTTYSELQTKIERRVIDLPTAVTTEVPDLINSAIREIEKKHNFKVMETLGGPYSTTLSTRTLQAVPSNFKEYRGNPYYVENLGGARDMTIVANIQGALDYYETDDTGYPTLILDVEPSDDDGTRNWAVYPLPDGSSDYDDGEYQIYIPYWRYLTDLSADGDSNWFTNNAEEWIVARATAEAFALDWDEQRSAYWLQKAAGWYKDVVKTDKLFRLSGVKTLVPHYQGVNHPNIRI